MTVMLSSLRAAHQHSGLKTSEGAGACGFLNKPCPVSVWVALTATAIVVQLATSALRLNELEYDPARSRQGYGTAGSSAALRLNVSDERACKTGSIQAPVQGTGGILGRSCSGGRRLRLRWSTSVGEVARPRGCLRGNRR